LGLIHRKNLLPVNHPFPAEVKARVVLLFVQTNRADLINSVEVEVTAAAQVSTEAGVSQVYVTITSFLFVPPCVDKRHTLDRY